MSAWNGLVEAGGLEPEGRDSELADRLRDALNHDASLLEEALARAPVANFVEALFRTIEPFPMMFGDVLRFFERAGTREGQRQWRLVVGNDVLELKHFEEFEKEWRTIECEFDVPAVDGSDAFLPNTVRNEMDGVQHLMDFPSAITGQMTGIGDVDAWLAAYDVGEYGPFPRSLLPEGLPEGLDDAARVVAAALDVVRRHGYHRDGLLAAYRARRGRMDGLDRVDGLDIWMIAQNETDYWLRNTVRILGRLLRRPTSKRDRFGAVLAARYARLGRRRLNAKLDVPDLVRFLSLPAWRKRHELFGVWVATEILAAADDHEVKISHADGELRFAFREAKIADIVSARPALSLYSERRTPFDSPIGEGRRCGVQPDFGLWRDGRDPGRCSMVVEVKHYKRAGRRNFREALVDYARAHPRAVVLLVNYGPVETLGELPDNVARRCRKIGDLTPRNREARDEFREAVRARVGEPAKTLRRLAAGNLLPGTVIVDTSASMAAVLESKWFQEFVADLELGAVEAVTLVDDGPRATVPMAALMEWVRDNALGRTTRLFAAVSALVEARGSTLVVTDSDGLRSLGAVVAEIEELDEGEEVGAKVVRFRARGTVSLAATDATDGASG